uniref:Kinesin-like protein n=1 Tax=Trypanosoma congolense (strain IL3000) TaxID=1068625 RepID=G0V0U9_TRYCI|nr:unnamed protein product [Trypanosoma congolense IL3000]
MDGNAVTEPEGNGVNIPEGSEVPSTIRVVVRVRPLSPVEYANPSVRNIVQCLKDGIVVNGTSVKMSSRYFGAPHAKPQPRQFHVDQVFHQHSSQIEVYEACRHVVAGAFEGVNGSILAYGSTGAGKTHTMFGGRMSAAGVIYQAVQDILEIKEELEENGKSVVTRCSFMEVYNEKVYDLLASANSQGKRTELHVQDSTKAPDNSYMYSPTNRRYAVNPESLIVRGLTQFTPTTAEDFAQCVERGHTNRFVASTDANAHSSRSHAIFTVEIEVKDTTDASLGTIGRIRFCDLAGSERAAGTSNVGARLREGGNINRSLLALSAVVQELVQRRERPERMHYIPYRDSKLTRLLQDSLGGNCHTLMLFCISPSSMNYEETINTMLFAMKAKKIRVAAKRHEFSVDSKAVAANQEALIEELRVELALAREELMQLRGTHPDAPVGGSHTSPRPIPPVMGKVPVLTFSMQRGDRESVHPHHEGTSRASVRSSMRTPKVMDFMESSELQGKFKDLAAAKETLYREMREAEEAHSDLKMRLRQQKWKLVHYLSAKRDTSSKGDSVGSATPVGVAGQKRAIREMEAELAAYGDVIQRLLERMNTADHELDTVRQELLREKQHPFLELLLDNIKLRQSCTEAECLAAHYHQEYRAVMSREEEFSQALSKCVLAIQDMLPLTTPNTPQWNGAKHALMYANLPCVDTENIISEFQRAMEEGKVVPKSFVEPSFKRLSVQDMEARLKQLVKSTTESKGLAGRSSPKRANVMGSNRGATLQAPQLNGCRLGPVLSKSQRTLKASNMAPLPRAPKAISRQNTGTVIRKANTKGPVRAGHRDPANPSLLCSRKSPSLCSPVRDALPSQLYTYFPRTENNKGSSAVFSRCATKVHLRQAEEVVPFARSFTATGIIRAKPNQVHGAHPLRERNSNFTPPRRQRRVGKDTGATDESAQAKRGQNEYLEERFRKLLHEVKLMNSDQASTESVTH